jgi:hypothetical protein
MCSLASLARDQLKFGWTYVANLPSGYFYTFYLPTMKGAALGRDRDSEREGPGA